jgi:3-deoxy-D-manno-octulosonic-acid transferase
MMNSIYSVSIFLYGLGIRVAAWFRPKARQWVRGRKGLFTRLAGDLQARECAWNGTVWFHCASLGEFEQGRPVMEHFREQYPAYRIVLTFYSPSGYDVRQNYPGADFIFYLPLDTPANARKLIRLIKPNLVFFIKYEYWFNILRELRRQRIPVFIISAVFHRDQPFFRWYGTWFRKQLANISWFFLQNDGSMKLAETTGIRQFTVTGDTRFDRVGMISDQARSFPGIERFAGNAMVFLGGSTWEPDEAMLLTLVKKDWPGMKFIIAPHEVHTSRIEDLENKLLSAHHSPLTTHHSLVIRYSSLDRNDAAAARVLIIDTIGILAHLYRYASFALVGGGFGSGIHNILEAAAFGKPVFFGPRYGKFTEARELLGAGGAFCVNTPEELEQIVSKLVHDPEALSSASAVCRNYVESNRGATRRIVQGIRNLGFIGPPA